MPVFAIDGDVLIGVAFIVEPSDESLGFDIGILTVFQLSVEGELC